MAVKSDAPRFRPVEGRSLPERPYSSACKGGVIGFQAAK